MLDRIGAVLEILLVGFDTSLQPWDVLRLRYFSSRRAVGSIEWFGSTSIYLPELCRHRGG